MEGAGVGSDGACLSGAVLVGELAWEVALSGLFGGMDPVPFLVWPLNLAGGRVCSFSLSPYCNPSFHFHNSLSILTAFFPFLFTSVLCCFLFWSSLLLGLIFLSIVTLRTGYFKFQSYNAVLYVSVTRCNSDIPSLFSEEESTFTPPLAFRWQRLRGTDQSPWAESLDEAEGTCPPTGGPSNVGRGL